jgi:hypothetical protein
MSEAVQVPLVELLQSVPANARLVIEESPLCTRFVPVGRYMHEAADAIKALEAERDAWQATADHHYQEAFALKAERDAAYQAGMERAAVICEQESLWCEDKTHVPMGRLCAAAIRKEIADE